MRTSNLDKLTSPSKYTCAVLPSIAKRQKLFNSRHNMKYDPNRPLKPNEFIELENLYGIVREYEGRLLPIGRHADLCKWLDEHGYGSYYNNKSEAMRVARQLLNNP